jgi:putative membrane protein
MNGLAVMDSNPNSPVPHTGPQEIDDVPDASNGADSISGDVINLIRGFCMGAADTVPGVSGGTVALVLGHYQRLLIAISQFDTAALRLLRSGRWTELWRHCDLRFLIALAVGLAIGAGSLATTMHWLLEHRMPQTFAVFFGLVLASGWIVAKGIKRWSPAALAGTAVAAVFAFWLAGLPTGESAAQGLFLFLAASVAICAMILPGISGAFVLLLLGMYHPVITMVKQLVHGDVSVQLLVNLGLFGAGCLVGLAAFSRLLRWLLQTHPDVTMAVLVGLMVGSLRRIWPLQRVTHETAGLPFKDRQFALVSPGSWDGGLLSLAALAIVAAVAVLVIERVAGKALPLGSDAVDRLDD